MSLDYAVKIALANEEYPKWKLGCVIKRGGAVQAVGWNTLKSEPTYLDNHSNCSVHAEERALRQMNYDAEGCILYVARIRRGGDIGMAKPCKACQRLIKRSGVKRVVYTINDETYGVWRPKRHP